MAKDRDGSIPEEEKELQERGDDGAHRGRHKKSKRKEETESEESSGGSGDDRVRSKKKRRRHRSSRKGHRRRGRASGSESDDSTSSDSYTESETDESGSESESEESDGEARKRRRKEKRRRERESEKERRRRKEREKERKRREEEKEAKRRRKKRKEKKKEKEEAKKGAVTNSWGKYGIIREIDMWNKRPEFTAWLSEVKQVNLEALSNWEEKQMFKEFMEDHNTATFPSKKYYDLDAYHRRKIEKAMKKGSKKFQEMERTVFDDEEQRRIELLRERERQKEEQVEALKRSMQSGMAQAMKEQSRLREEMMYQYKLGNFEAAAAIQKRLDPDVAM
ncbi:unnamed protein product [Musa acuminata subsp. malaccensis]|uniref:(wild Malaysian banana) hypothetical protein n=1 Tax=Musa acuminata subsp. malaccensis TaxID=214687 RepID=A0A804L9M5_MUSAM|nr:PREDICTED: RNA-binding protein 25 [Musa acuminata subsp. malaccensis]CAG1865070.1 unnamed protein product [Musa acuminata subsp. malaccensis]